MRRIRKMNEEQEQEQEQEQEKYDVCSKCGATVNELTREEHMKNHIDNLERYTSDNYRKEKKK